jgi:ATP-dependent 26S proteasome regulatory subunit
MTTNGTQVPMDIGLAYGGGISSIKHYSEFMLNKMMFDKLLNSKKQMEFTPLNIAKLLAIMCAPDIKNSLVDIGKYLANLVKDSPQYLFAVIGYIYKTVRMIREYVSSRAYSRWYAARDNAIQQFAITNVNNDNNQQIVKTYKLNADIKFITDLIKYIDVNKSYANKECNSMSIRGVAVTRYYVLNDVQINFKDNEQCASIKIMKHICYSTEAKLVNMQCESILDLYRLEHNMESKDKYSFPAELNILEYWDLLRHGQQIKDCYPFVDEKGIISKHINFTAFCKGPLNSLLYRSFNNNIDNFKEYIKNLYNLLYNFILKQNYRVYGIPYAKPKITAHCLTYIIIRIYIGKDTDKINKYIKHDETALNYINPLLINESFIDFLNKIDKTLSQFKDIQLLLSMENPSESHHSIDVYWSCKSIDIYSSKSENCVQFGTSPVSYLPIILNTGIISNKHLTPETFNKFIEDNVLVNSYTKIEQQILDITVTTNETACVNVDSMFHKFLEAVRTSILANSSSISTVQVKYIKLKQIEITNEIDNPAYKDWLRKKDLYMSNVNVSADKAQVIDSNIAPSQENNQQASSHAVHGTALAYLVESMPPEKLVSTSVKNVIDEQTINSACRYMQSLSLKKRDKDKLMRALNDYMEDGPDLKAWGIKNKLNILLYGEPGTGKSSTIEAIATYLNKPIYYVDMKEAKTNNDLKLIFDHVNLVTVGGGIIVMEDIDAMTSCVHKRINAETKDGHTTNKHQEHTVVDVMSANESPELTLEFFLNILDGVLTVDKSIFITTTNHIEKLDPAFYRAGRFNLKIELSACNHDQLNYIYKNMRGCEIPAEILNKIPEDVYKPAEIIFHLKDYVRDFTLTDEEILSPFIINCNSQMADSLADY